jgi:carotenoid cleavage dioxygenase-like enzyme
MSLDRRDFLKLGAGLGALPLAQGCGEAATDELELERGAENVSTGPALPNRFPASFVTASRAELDVELKVLAGALPIDLEGHVFVVGAMPQSDGSPVFNGDGMIYRLDFGGPSVALKTRLAKTPCYYADLATAGTGLAFGNRGAARMSTRLGTRNQANTAFVRMGERIAVTFDGGRPYEIDPTTLELVTPIGGNDEWVSGTPEVPGLIGGPFKAFFSGAHPYYDENTKDLFLVNYKPSFPVIGGLLGGGDTWLLRWDGASRLERHRLVVNGRGVEITQSAHQMAVTRDYVIIMDTAFQIEFEQILLSRELVRPETVDTALYIVRRKDLKKGGGDVPARKVVIPREIAHFICDYENPGGRITLHCTHGSAWLASEWLRTTDVQAGDWAPVRRDLRGMLVTSGDQTPIAKHVIDGETGRRLSSNLFFEDKWTWSVTLYAHRGASAAASFENVYWSSVGFQKELLTKRVLDHTLFYKYRHVPIWNLPYKEGRPAALFRTNMRTMSKADADGYSFPAGRAASSPTFCEAAGKAGTSEGYVVVTVMSDDRSTPGSSGDEFWIFDGRDLAKGPICRLGHPEVDLAYTLHTLYMPSIQPRTASYRIPVRADFEPLVKKSGSDVQRLFDTAVYPKFA